VAISWTSWRSRRRIRIPRSPLPPPSPSQPSFAAWETAQEWKRGRGERKLPLRWVVTTTNLREPAALWRRLRRPFRTRREQKKRQRSQESADQKFLLLFERSPSRLLSLLLLSWGVTKRGGRRGRRRLSQVNEEKGERPEKERVGGGVLRLIIESIRRS
jgi:hypothetical protein